MRTVQRGIGRSSRDARSWGARRWRNSLERASDRCSRLEERGAAANARGELDEFIVTTDNNERISAPRQSGPPTKTVAAIDSPLSGFLPLGRTSRRPLRETRRNAPISARAIAEGGVGSGRVLCEGAARARGRRGTRRRGFHLSVDFPDAASGRPNAWGATRASPRGCSRADLGARGDTRRYTNRTISSRARRARRARCPRRCSRRAAPGAFTDASPFPPIASPPSLRRRRTASTRWPCARCA
jgi:hypothetical protein